LQGEWQGKKDVNGAVAAWTPAQAESELPAEEVIEHLITEAKQQQGTATAATPGKG
jgi:hypothetical protein